MFAFWTGADIIPQSGFEQQLKIEFYPQEADVRRLPSSSTCVMFLWLPRDVSEPDILLQMLVDAVKMSAGFGKI